MEGIMNRKLAVTLVGLLLFFGIAIVLADVEKYSIEFSNKSDATITYFLYRVDHHIESHPKPISFAVGTLKPGKKWTVKSDKGIYYIEWFNEDTYKVISKTETFTLNQNMKFVIGPQPGGKKYEVKRTSPKGSG